MFSRCEINEVVFVVCSPKRFWNYVMRLEVFPFQEGVVLLYQIVVNSLIVHIIFTFLLLKSLSRLHKYLPFYNRNPTIGDNL